MVRNSWLTPLCPAGHLPLKGGDRLDEFTSPLPRPMRWVRPLNESISPLEGEMAGRPEGGIPPAVPDVWEHSP
jgi:hypothetical protein